MNALTDADPRVRLRKACDEAPGKKVVVDVDDLRSILIREPAAPVDLDALTGHTVPAQTREEERLTGPAPIAPPQGRPPQGDRLVVLAVTTDDARDLARALWDTDPPRVEAWGLFDLDFNRHDLPRTSPVPRCEAVKHCRRALTQLAAQQQRRGGEQR